MTLTEILKTEKRLSNREAEVAALVARGWTNKEVANALFVTEKTVKFHLTNIYKRMQLKSRAQLIVWCLPRIQSTESVPVKPTPCAPVCPVVQAVQNTAPMPRPVGTNQTPDAAA